MTEDDTSFHVWDGRAPLLPFEQKWYFDSDNISLPHALIALSLPLTKSIFSVHLCTYLEISVGERLANSSSPRPVGPCSAVNRNFPSLSRSSRVVTKVLHILHTPSYKRTGRSSAEKTSLAMTFRGLLASGGEAVDMTQWAAGTGRFTLALVPRPNAAVFVGRPARAHSKSDTRKAGILAVQP